jgi:hypothetical protein
MNDLEGFISILLRRNYPTFGLTIDGEMSVIPKILHDLRSFPTTGWQQARLSLFYLQATHWRGTVMLKGSDDGVQHSGLLGFCISSIARYSVKHNVSETGSVFILS